MRISIRLRSQKLLEIDEINRIAEILGVQFPNDFINFVMTHNGSVAEDNVVDGFDGISINKFIDIRNISKLKRSIELFPEDGIPICECPSGDYVYILSSKRKIMFWDHELDEDFIIADSFGEFVEKIKPCDFGAIGPSEPEVVEGWVSPGFKPTFD